MTFRKSFEEHKLSIQYYPVNAKIRWHVQAGLIASRLLAETPCLMRELASQRWLASFFLT
jgi:hypothetical protein